MPNITKRKNKAGETISYRIRVARGYDSEGNKLKPYEKTWKPQPGMTEKQMEKEVQRQALLFEEQCKTGLAGDAPCGICSGVSGTEEANTVTYNI